MSRDSAPPLDPAASRRGQSTASRSSQAASGASLAALRAQLNRFRELGSPPPHAELRHFRSLLASVASPESPDRHHGVQSLSVLDAVLDSPLDIDDTVLQRLSATLESEALSCRTGGDHRTHGLAGVPAEAASGKEVADVPSSRSRTIRGLHVRQGGHDFVLPFEKVECVLAVDFDQLPTVLGRPIVHVSGAMCDVIRLVDHLGLLADGDSFATRVIAILELGRRICLAIDEVVGHVETTVMPLEGLLPGVTTLVEVASLESGGLALVPDFSQIRP